MAKRKTNRSDAEEAILSVLEDTIEQKRRADEEKEKLQITLNSIGDGAFVVDKGGVITFFNPEAERLSGYKAKEVVGKLYSSVLQFVDEEDRTKKSEVIEQALATKQTRKMEDNVILIGKKEVEIPVSDSAAPIIVNGELIGCVIIFRDMIIEREINRKKTEFISIASHQLRTPITSIRWIVEVLLEKKDYLPPETSEYLQDLSTLATDLGELVRTLLNMSRIESDRLEILPKRTDLTAFLMQTADEYQKEQKQKGVKISFANKVNEKIQIPIDKSLLLQVYRTLVDNAIKYSKQGKATVGITFSADKENGYLVEVKDNGIGINKKEQKNIFQRFYRAPEARLHSQEGNGLGLFMAKIITQNYGGKIGFTSTDGHGTTFWFTVPKEGMKARRIQHGKSLEI